VDLDGQHRVARGLPHQVRALQVREGTTCLAFLYPLSIVQIQLTAAIHRLRLPTGGRAPVRSGAICTALNVAAVWVPSFPAAIRRLCCPWHTHTSLPHTQPPTHTHTPTSSLTPDSFFPHAPAAGCCHCLILGHAPRPRPPLTYILSHTFPRTHSLPFRRWDPEWASEYRDNHGRPPTGLPLREGGKVLQQVCMGGDSETCVQEP
jgi:hypothetical protein